MLSGKGSPEDVLPQQGNRHGSAKPPSTLPASRGSQSEHTLILYPHCSFLSFVQWQWKDLDGCPSYILAFGWDIEGNPKWREKSCSLTQIKQVWARDPLFRAKTGFVHSECSLDIAKYFSPTCQVFQLQNAGGGNLQLRKSQGGFPLLPIYFTLQLLDS